MRVLLAFLLVSAAASAQPECSASGVVVNSATREMISRAAIKIGRTVAATTDDTGKWTIDHLPCGKVGIIASRPTFLPARVVFLELSAENPKRDVRLELTPQAAITGRVVDEFGDPVTGARVMARRSMAVDGARQYVDGIIGVTNDIGEYRIAALAAGHYLICAGEQCATPLTITAGYNGLVDFRLSGVVSRRLSGTVAGIPEGAAVQLTLTNDSTTVSAAVSPTGEFELTAPVGSYTLQATTFSGSDRLIARTRIAVGDRDIDNISLSLGHGVEVTGTVRTLSQNKPGIDSSKVEVMLYHPVVRGAISPARIVWNGDRSAFTASGLAPDTYRLDVSAPPGLHVERVTAGGSDITDSEILINAGYPPIEVVLSDGGGALEGTAQPASAIVILNGNRHWFAVAGAKGHFRADGLPAGDYKLSAWDDLTKVPYRDAAWMEVHAKTASATVTDSQSTSVTLEQSIAPDE